MAFRATTTAKVLSCEIVAHVMVPQLTVLCSLRGTVVMFQICVIKMCFLFHTLVVYKTVLMDGVGPTLFCMYS